MASLAPRPCTWPGCGELVEGGGACVAHRREYGRSRGTTTERGYDGDHERLRAAVLADFPICQIRRECSGAVATDLDHIIPIRERPDLRLARSNVQAACGPCNEAKARQKRRKSAGIREGAGVFVAV